MYYSSTVRALARLLSRYWLPLCLLLLMPISVAQRARAQEVHEWFVTMPDSLLPFMSQDTRYRILADYATSHVADAHSESTDEDRDQRLRPLVLSLSAAYMSVQLLPSMDLQLRVLQRAELQDEILCMVLTSRVAPAQSIVRFFDHEWHPLDHDALFEQPDPMLFFGPLTPQDRPAVERLLQEVGWLHYDIRMDGPHDVMTVRTTALDQELIRRMYPKAVALLRDHPIQMIWNGAAFETMKM